MYQTLVKHGPLTISALAKLTGLYRPLIYRQLPGLEDKGLVSETRSGRRVLYTAENPAALGNLVNSLQTELEEALPGLQSDFEHAGGRPVIRYFQGRSGIGHVYEHLLRTAKKSDIIYRYEALSDYNILRRYYPPFTGRSPWGLRLANRGSLWITESQSQPVRGPELERMLQDSSAAPSVMPFECGASRYLR